MSNLGKVLKTITVEPLQVPLPERIEEPQREVKEEPARVEKDCNHAPEYSWGTYDVSAGLESSGCLVCGIGRGNNG